MSQSRTHSALEAFTNIAVGYGVNFVANLLIFPVFGWEISVAQNLALGVFYTLVSFARSYVLRRIYNAFDGGRA